MTLYLISQHTASWSLSRLIGSISTTATGIHDEEEAIAKALKEARKDQPSQVIRISDKGDAKLIAAFNGITRFDY